MKSNPSTGSDEPETIADEIHGIRIMLQADRVALRQGIMDSEEGFVSFLKGFDYTLTEVMKLEAKAALESPRGANAPSELLLQIKNDFILTMPQSRAGKPISMKEAASLRVYKGLTELGEILRADSHSDAALAALKARIDGERKRANERIEAKRQQGYVYGALQYECNDDVVRLALLERLLSEESQK